MKPVVTAHYLQQSFSAYDFDWLWMQEKLQLDLAHIQLLRDFQAGWPKTDPKLLLVLLFLVDAVNQGSLCLLLDDDKLNVHARRMNLNDVQAHIKALDLPQFTLACQVILVVENNRLYFQKHHHQQTLLQRDLSTLITASEITMFDHDEIKLGVSEVVKNLPYQLDSQQIKAMQTTLLQPFSIISGGPGTGKTTILLSLIRVMTRLGIPINQIALAAPTGRAAKRMTESIENGLIDTAEPDGLNPMTAADMAATTIHRLLGSNPLQPNRFHANNHLPFEVVVIDEVSMVDLELMNQLIQAIGPSTRLVFLGDQFQLPSVQSGALLADLMPPVGHKGLNTADFLATLARLWPDDGLPMPIEEPVSEVQLLTDKVTVLQVSKRCQPHIAELSEGVRQGHAEIFIAAVKRLDQSRLKNWAVSNQNRGVFWYDYTTEKQRWMNVCQAWYIKHYLSCTSGHQSFVDAVRALRYQSLALKEVQQSSLQPIFSAIKSQRILTLTHGGQTGTEHVNTLIADWLKNDLQIESINDCFHGAVIMVKRNDATLGLYNGDVGLVLEVAPKQFQVYFETAKGYQAYSIHLIPDHTLAFAMTVHKSQGSEFDHVMIPLTEQLESPLLTREIIYTGMTRAKQSVLFYGSETALKRAITHKTVRNSGLTFWYNQD